MPYGTILDSGYLVGTGSAINLPIVQGASWIHLVNQTEMAAANVGHGLEYYWQKGFADNVCNVTFRHDANTVNIQTSTTLGVGGITFYDSSIAGQPVTATVATQLVDSISGALPGVVGSAHAWATTLATGDIVRIYNTVGALELGGIDFTVGGVVANTSFTLANMPAIVAAAAPGATALWRKVPYDSNFYPTHRYISKIRAWPTDTTKTQITMTVTHGYQVGQQVRFMVPAAYGMTQLNGVQASIVAIGLTDGTSTNTIVVDYNIAGFTAFAFPATAAAPFTPAMVVPIGMNTATALTQVPPVSDITDATRNTGVTGVTLATGITSPAGSANDVIYYVIGSSYNL